MYILFFGGFILFLDLINFAIDLNKKIEKEAIEIFSGVTFTFAMKEIIL